MRPPPTYIPPDLDYEFASNPFDGRMRVPGPNGHLVFTELGLIVAIYAHLRRGRDPAVAVASIRQFLKREHRDDFVDLEEMLAIQ